VKLLVENTEVTNGTIHVRWCLTREETDELWKRKIRRPHVLIVVVPPKGHEQRWVAPLDQLMQPVVFRKPGNNRIFGAIIWDTDDDVARLKANYLGTTKKAWDTSLIDEERRWAKSELRDRVAQIDAVVPEGVFAKEPPRWLSWWVNWGYKTPNRDQCQFRERALVAVPKIPVGLLVGFLTLVLYAIALTARCVGIIVFLLLGRRHIMWRRLHDMNSSQLVIRGDTDDNWVFFSRWRWQITPFFVVFYTTIILLVNQAHPVVSSFGGLFLMVGAWILVLYALTGFAIGISAGISAIPIVAERFIEKTERENLERRKKEIPSYATDPAVWCEQISSLPVGLGSLPPKHRTVYLRFWDLKAQVCKPFAES